jgi:hypothetical protein
VHVLGGGAEAAASGRRAGALGRRGRLSAWGPGARGQQKSDSSGKRARTFHFTLSHVKGL